MRIGEHDLLIKIQHARVFLKEGNKVQFTLQFKGREMAHLELGRDLFKKIKEELYPVSKIERDARMEGRRMTLVLQPDHKSPAALKPPATGPGAAAPGAPARPPAAAVGVGIGKAPSPMQAGSSLNIPGRPVQAAAPTQAPAPEAAPRAVSAGR